MTYPWEDPNAPSHIIARRPVMELPGPKGIRIDLPIRRSADNLPAVLDALSFGIVVMSHRGSSNGRLSVLLSSIPENYPVVVSSDSIADIDVERDMKVTEHHKAVFTHCTPWGGRAANAINCMNKTVWKYTLFLCDDVWLAPECVRQALHWTYLIQSKGVPLACLGVPGWESYHNWKHWGFEAWQQCLDEPWKLEAIPPNKAFEYCPALYKNPFGACMVINREAYTDLGGFSKDYWAHDDVFNHRVWTSGRWVSAAYYGRGYIHFGAQSWHHGESVEYVGEFKNATGLSTEASGAAQVAGIERARKLYGKFFEDLGGTDAV
jgi:hypothetical protein